MVHANQSKEGKKNKKKTAFAELLVIATNVVASNSQDVFFSSFFKMGLLRSLGQFNIIIAFFFFLFC